MHHIERPRRFFAEVRRLLGPGGRLVAVEPAITPVSLGCVQVFSFRAHSVGAGSSRRRASRDQPRCVRRQSGDTKFALLPLSGEVSTLFPELVIETLDRVELAHVSAFGWIPALEPHSG